MLTPSITTLLDIIIAAPPIPGVNPYSARGLKGTLKPIDLAQGDDKLARTINGTLISIGAPQMQKYRLEIQGEDQAPPALENLWAGQVVTVFCHAELARRTGDTASRIEVAGSTRVEGNYTYYRPRLIMRVVEWESALDDEWEVNYNWSLTLEEV
jgi:hypothetical protein